MVTCALGVAELWYTHTALLAAGCPELVIKTLGRWSSEAFWLYCRSNALDVIKWKERMGRVVVDPVAVHGTVKQLAVPQHGTAAWDGEMEEMAKGFQDSDFLEEEDAEG